MPLDPHLRTKLEQLRGMLRRLEVSARSVNFERMVYVLDLALAELISARPSGGDDEPREKAATRPELSRDPPKRTAGTPDLSPISPGPDPLHSDWIKGPSAQPPSTRH